MRSKTGDRSRATQPDQDFARVEAQLDRATEERDAALVRAARLERDLKLARQKLRAQEARTAFLQQGVRELQQVAFGGDLYPLILHLCMVLTESEAGAYLTYEDGDSGGGRTWHVRTRRGLTATDQDGDHLYRFLCDAADRAMEADEPLMLEADGLETLSHLDIGEPIRACMVAPVSLLDEFDGVVIVADKRFGEFREVDARQLLSVGEDASVAARNQHLQTELGLTYTRIVQLLAAVIQTQDPPTHEHSLHTAALAARTAARLGLEPNDTAVACYAALLHDIGKIGVDSSILNKPGPLSDTEREVVKSHVAIGRDIIGRVPALAEVAEAVYRHHEWYDGTGYPDGVGGDQLPMPACIVAVVDAFSAMITRRSYKDAYPLEHARQELADGAGTQFMPDVVQAFLEVLDESMPVSQDQAVREARDATPGDQSICGLEAPVERHWEQQRLRRRRSTT